MSSGQKALITKKISLGILFYQNRRTNKENMMTTPVVL